MGDKLKLVRCSIQKMFIQIVIRTSDAPLKFVIPTSERSDRGGICCVQLTQLLQKHFPKSPPTKFAFQNLQTHTCVMRITHKMQCIPVLITLEILLLNLITIHFCTFSATVINAVLDTAFDSGDECASRKNFQPEDFHMTKNFVLVCRTGPAF